MSPRHRLLRQRQESASHTDHDHQEDSQEGTGIANKDSGCCSRLLAALAPAPGGRTSTGIVPRRRGRWGTYTRSGRKA
jgi:hypothetical protein